MGNASSSTKAIESKKVSLLDWMENSKSGQESFSKLLNNCIWDEFDLDQVDHHTYLFKKISLFLFGNPKTEEDFGKNDFGLPKDKKDVVNDILYKCMKHSFHKRKIRLGFIFVFVYLNEDIQTFVPLIRVMSNSDNQSEPTQNNIFIDHVGRVYENFNHYKKTNTWDSCWLCFPVDGFYTTNLEIDFLNQSSDGNIVKAVDTIANVVSICSTIGLTVGTAMSCFPPTALIGSGVSAVSGSVGAPSIVYGVGRSVGSIIDRNNHEQSINFLKDTVARQYWLTIASGLVSVGATSSARILANSARTGKVVSASTRAVCTGITVTSLSLSGISMILSGLELLKQDEITTLDVLQFASSLFLFAHSVVSFQTAVDIIKDSQDSEIKETKKSLLAEHHDKYDAHLEGTRDSLGKGSVKINEIEGQAKFIREIKKIENLNDFYQQFQIEKKEPFYKNNKLTLNVKSFAQLNDFDKKNVLKLSEQLSESKITLKKYNKSIKRITRKNDMSFGRSLDNAHIAKENNIIFGQNQANAEEFLKKIYKVEDVGDIQIGSQKLEAKPHEMQKLEKLVKHNFNNGDKDYMAVANKMGEKLEITNVGDYCAVGEYAVRKVQLEVKNRMKQNPNPKRRGGKAKDFYKRQVINELLTNDGAFNQMFDSFSALSEHKNPNVGNKKISPMVAANNHDKYKKNNTQNQKNKFDALKSGNLKKVVLENEKNLLNKMFENMGITQEKVVERIINIGIEEIKNEVNKRTDEHSKEKEKEKIKMSIINELLNDNDKFNQFADYLKRILTDKKVFDEETFFPNDDINNLTPQKYIEIVEEMVGESISNIKWSQDGRHLFCFFFSEHYGPMMMHFDNLPDKITVIAFLYKLVNSSKVKPLECRDGS